jgi:hypothetical protein
MKIEIVHQNSQSRRLLTDLQVCDIAVLQWMDGWMDGWMDVPVILHKVRRKHADELGGLSRKFGRVLDFFHRN